MATYTHPVTGEVKEYIPYDELTEEQRECVNCAEDNQRYDAACAHLGIDKLMSDRNALIRNRIASDGFFLESFAEDDDPLVRAEVALQGYGLDILVFDSEWCGFAEDYDFEFLTLEQASGENSILLPKDILEEEQLQDNTLYIVSEKALNDNSGHIDLLQSFDVGYFAVLPTRYLYQINKQSNYE